jgi:hypothetical protein
MKAISVNFPNVKIDFCVFSSGEVASCINKNCLAFKNIREFVRALAFLNGAKFTPRALDTLKKEKTSKKKEFFLYWVANCVNYGHQKARSLEDLRQEFNKLYNVEIKQGRKKRPKEETTTQGLTECTEQG